MTIKHTKTRETILTESLNIFGRIGYRNTNIQSIAKSCKKGRRTIYTYFKSKKDIYNEVIKKECLKLSDLISDTIKGINDPELKLAKYIDIRMSLIRTYVLSYKALTTCFFKKRYHFESIRKDFDSQEKQIIASILKDGVERKVFKISNIELSTHNLQMALKALEDIFVKKKNSYKEKQQQEDIRNILLFGIMNRYLIPRS